MFSGKYREAWQEVIYKAEKYFDHEGAKSTKKEEENEVFSLWTKSRFSKKLMSELKSTLTTKARRAQRRKRETKFFFYGQKVHSARS